MNEAAPNSASGDAVDPVRVVERIYDLTEGIEPEDAELAEVFDPEVELDLSARIVNPRTFRGFDGVREMLTDLGETWGEQLRIEPEQFFPAGDYGGDPGEVVVYLHIRAAAPESGDTVSLLIAHLWRLRDGKVVLLRLYNERADALAAAGIEPPTAER